MPEEEREDEVAAEPTIGTTDDSETVIIKGGE